MSTDKYDMYVREITFTQNYVLILSINCATNVYIVKVIKINRLHRQFVKPAFGKNIVMQLLT